MLTEENLRSEAACVAAAAAASVTPGMVERLAGLAERAASAVDLLTDPNVLVLLEQVRASAPALTHALQRIDTAARSGALDTLLDLADVVHVARVSMSDGMVSRMAGLVKDVLELADTGMVLAAEAQAQADAAGDPAVIGPVALLRALKEPGMQRSLKFLLALSRRLDPAATR